MNSTGFRGEDENPLQILNVLNVEALAKKENFKRWMVCEELGLTESKKNYLHIHVL